MKSYKKNPNQRVDEEQDGNNYKNDLIKNLSKRNYNYLKMNVNSLIDQAMNSGLLNSPYGLNLGSSNFDL